MKISLNSIKEIYKQAGVADFLPRDINVIAQKIGAQLGEIEKIVDLGKKYRGIIVAKVISCEPHPNADRLKLCIIDDGGVAKGVKRREDGLVQVVCGAPNVHTGMLAAWIPPGVTVPSTFDKDPFTLEAREIRGQFSNGMLASANELGINDEHTGILEIDKQAKPGDSFAQLYKLDDYVVDIENKMFTHRPDCFGLLGVSRELAGIYQKPFTSPEWYEINPKFPAEETKELKLEVINEIPELAPRFCAVAMRGVKVGPSPLWLQVALAKTGIKSINNIVDLTNFYMVYTGQPLHAYDYDKVAKLSGKGAVIKVRLPKKGEKLKLLNGKEIIPEKDTIMIATDKHPIGIGGVIGGADTEVDDSTQNIILECANFDSYSIRRSSMHYGIFTDAVTRFTKNQSPHQNLAVLSKIIGGIGALSGGKVASRLFDLRGKLARNKQISVSAGFINERLGLKLTGEEIALILKNVEFKVSRSGQNLEVTAPFWRTDIEIAEDVVEEVGRLYGYDHLSLKLPKKTITPSSVSEELKFNRKLRERLSALGANEVLSYSFIRGDLLDIAGQDPAKSFKVKNALSPDLQYYRQSITPSLLEKIHSNIKSGFDDFALFELGKAHVKDKETDGLPDEFRRLALVTASKDGHSGPAFYTARKYLADLLSVMGVAENDISFEPIKTDEKDPAAAYYQSGRAANIIAGGKLIGRIGEYSRDVSVKLKLPELCAGFEISLLELEKLGARKTYTPLSRYPAAEQDICLKTDKSLGFSDIRNALGVALDKHSPADVSCRTRCIDIFTSGDKFKQTTFRVETASYERTLTSEVVNLLFDKVADDVKRSIKAEIV